MGFSPLSRGHGTLFLGHLPAVVDSTDSVLSVHPSPASMEAASALWQMLEALASRTLMCAAAACTTAGRPLQVSAGRQQALLRFVKACCSAQDRFGEGLAGCLTRADLELGTRLASSLRETQQT